MTSLDSESDLGPREPTPPDGLAMLREATASAGTTVGVNLACGLVLTSCAGILGAAAQEWRELAAVGSGWALLAIPPWLARRNLIAASAGDVSRLHPGLALLETTARLVLTALAVSAFALMLASQGRTRFLVLILFLGALNWVRGTLRVREIRRHELDIRDAITGEHSVASRHAA